ncbi:serine/threonine-protein kinase [Paraliomyxa miuraensis]|uniref:serine/threonine-protein kinase n=1 Tax=Paraliomyxa miuraensis TaxID=376150 RepID=UPI0022518816|nr:serine/threonine-protein kinase [Paraliomyxa miuraensis]MCX4245075.1 serine/threonine protein kinase [Paraliomyxa miuraensis]
MSLDETSRQPGEFVRGDVFGQRWRLEEFISSGGMGHVWRATDLRLHESVAIKLMDPGLVATEYARERFMREARAAAKLRGPNVVQVFDFNVDAIRHVPYMAMELLRGEDLARRIARGPLGYLQTLSIITDICGAIAPAHRAGIIHRDLKPANVYLVQSDPGPVAKVLDFGVVKLAVDQAPATGAAGEPLTLAGAKLGTLAYMSPEQIDRPHGVDHRADLWSIGIMAFECLAGQRPYRADSTIELIHQICLAKPAVPSQIAEVPRGFDAWFARATHRDREQRFGSVAELLDGFRSLSSEPSPRKPRTTRPSVGSGEPLRQLETWASDASQLDIRLLEDLTFKNAVVSEFLDSGNKHFVSGSKGLGKTLLLTYKRFLLSAQYQGSEGRSPAGIKFVPEGRPYLDLMGDLPSVSQAEIELMSSLARCKRIWGFGFRVCAISHQPGLLGPEDAEDLDEFPRRLKAMLRGRGAAEPTIVVKELLGLSYAQLNRLIDQSESFLEYKLRSLHSPMFIFVDKLDQALRSLPREAWVHMQAGMIEAAWDLMNTNTHIKIFATIREEAFASYESDIKTNLYGATSTLRYTKRDLQELLEKLTFFYERLPLRDFVILDTVSTQSSRSEPAFDFIFRHTLGRPRDLVIIASEISRHRESLDERTFKRLVQDTSASILVSNVFDEMRVFLEVLCERGPRGKFLASLPYNILPHDEVVELWCRFHGVDRDYYELHGREAEDVYHPFRELYDCGLLGIVVRDASSERRSQRFRQPHDAVAGSQRQLPRSSHYLLHPALSALVAQLAAGGDFEPFRQIVVGHEQPWPAHFDALVEIQRAIFRSPESRDEDCDAATFELLRTLDTALASGESFETTRTRLRDGDAFRELVARLEQLGRDELHLALLELFER